MTLAPSCRESDLGGEWMKQVARNLTDMWDGFLLGKRYLIHDRDPLFTEAVRGLLRDSGVKPLRLPANSPNLNAYAERFVLSTSTLFLGTVMQKALRRSQKSAWQTIAFGGPVNA